MRTKKQETIWRNAMEDWNTFYSRDSFQRKFILEALDSIPFRSLLEVGCNCGHNLFNIIQRYPRSEIGGLDINSGSIEMARSLLPPQIITLEVGTADDIPFSSKSLDVVLCDNLLMYIGNDKIDKVMTEITRVVRNHIILFEPHIENNWKRLKENLKNRNRYIHNYEELLHKYGYWDIQCRPVKGFYNIITARI